MKYYRKETDSIDETPARELSSIIIDGLPIDVEDGEKYFELEDKLTEIINSYFKTMEDLK